MNTLVLFMTLCGNLVLVAVHGEPGTVIGPPAYIQGTPEAMEIIKESMQTVIDRKTIKLEDVTGVQCG